ncbi:H-NS family nucleoid-associated regulatory protein [Burkholderia ambifaria]|uniref:H-NS histone family protein n=1 Tax=Burkholderia ambifaria TaxID=152480 RepID=UPI003C7B4AAB
MSQFDITGAELDERLGAQRVPGSAVIPRYRDPASGATWTGRGRRPRWFDAQEAERFRIKSPATEPSVGQDT